MWYSNMRKIDWFLKSLRLGTLAFSVLQLPVHKSCGIQGDASIFDLSILESWPCGSWTAPEVTCLPGELSTPGPRGGRGEGVDYYLSMPSVMTV